MTRPLWTPEKSRASQSLLGGFTEWLASQTGKSFADYGDLHRYSVDQAAGFWSQLWDFTRIIGEKGEPPYLVGAERMSSARFFPRARLNFAENLLAVRGPGPALVFWGEGNVKRRLSWDELSAEV